MLTLGCGRGRPSRSGQVISRAEAPGAGGLCSAIAEAASASAAARASPLRSRRMAVPAAIGAADRPSARQIKALASATRAGRKPGRAELDFVQLAGREEEGRAESAQIGDEVHIMSP